MSDYLKEKVYLIGTGYMANEYAKVLQALNIDFTVIGRGKDRAKNFEKEFKKKVCIGGVANWLQNNNYDNKRKVIVAVGMEQLAPVTIELLRKGFKNILVEKPAGLNFEEIKKVADEAKIKNANVFIAYNRRFYASVIKTKEIIEEDGGVTSFNFEFTEWSHEIEKLDKAPGVKENWFLANSTHVVDLAFYLGGKPKEISCYTKGGLKWHPKASIYSGAGVSENGALFSYQANWEAPGRWGVEVLTKKHRLILRPLEKLQLQNIGSVQKEFVEIDDELDIRFKPGLYWQTKSFLKGEMDNFLNIESFIIDLSNYKEMNSKL